MKQKYDEDKNKLEILYEIDEHIKSQPDHWLIESTLDCAVVAKMVNLSINRINHNNVFQPYETAKEEKHCVLMLLELGAKMNYSVSEQKTVDALLFSSLKKQGLPITRIICPEAVAKAFND